ncbi:hypothetical protein MKW92_043127, partial [Papaver armeniacum]
DTIHERNEQVRSNADAMCTEYRLPLLNFNFPVVPPNEEEIYIFLVVKMNMKRQKMNKSWEMDRAVTLPVDDLKAIKRLLGEAR